MYACRVETSFAAAHRRLGSPGGSVALHGHALRVELLVAERQLDRQGLTIDLGDPTAWRRAWTDEHRDRPFPANDQGARLAEPLPAPPETKLDLFGGVNPSSEAMARESFGAARERFGDRGTSVRVRETPLQHAEYALRGAPVASPAWAQALT